MTARQRGVSRWAASGSNERITRVMPNSKLPAGALHWIEFKVVVEFCDSVMVPCSWCVGPSLSGPPHLPCPSTQTHPWRSKACQ